jgi:hypothetical protein
VHTIHTILHIGKWNQELKIWGPRSSLKPSIPVEVLEEQMAQSASTLLYAKENNKTKEKSSERQDSPNIDDQETKT